MSSFYHLFSLQETYLSADDLRINLWHMEITDQSFNIVDIKPANMEELTEVKFASLRQTLEGLVLISVALSGYHCFLVFRVCVLFCLRVLTQVYGNREHAQGWFSR